jgi:hypothetical protein
MYPDPFQDEPRTEERTFIGKVLRALERMASGMSRALRVFGGGPH